MATKKVAVVGGGVSGLVAIKCCLDEGLHPVCFEQHDDIGGIWNYTEYPRPNQGAASFKNLITNTSKEAMAFSDFPMPEHYPQYMSHSQYMEYLRSYAEHFDLVKYINFSTKVVNITKTEDHNFFTGCWKVNTKNEDHTMASEVYDAVMICTGAANSPYYPDIDGMYTDYKGQITHMHSYRTHYEFKDKTVLVVGNQNSAGDAAVDISHAAKQVYWSVGRGTTMLSRFTNGNVPLDLGVNRFLLSTLFPLIPGASRIIAKSFKEKRAEVLIKHEQYGLSTKDSPLPFNGGPLLVNEELKYKIMSGRVKCKGNLIRLHNQKAEFSDGTSVDDIDVVFFATGYNLDLSYVDDRIIQGLGRNRTPWPVYKWVFPIDLQHSTLALIALTPAGGPVPPLAEIHCRWVTSVMAGKRKLPPREEMKRYQMEKQKLYQQRCGGRFQPILLHLLEDSAEELDANPSFWKLYKKSPLFAVKAQFGPVVSALYRIVGHGALPDGIKNYKDICYRAFNTPNYQLNSDRTVSQEKGSFLTRYLVFGVLIVAILWMWKLCG